MAAIMRKSVASSRHGFTLVELLVVIGIAVVLMAIAVPVARSLREGNRMITCKAQLQQIGHALKAYRTDEMGMPPFYIEANQNPDSDMPAGPGLWALHAMGYVRNEMALHCPRDVYTESDDPDFFQSYMVKDDDATAATELNKYPYLPFRGVTDDTDPNYRRQLQRGSTPGPGEVSVPVVDPNWQPADDTVVTWCKWHKDTVTRGDQGQYHVLFWDGSVVRVDEDVMTNAGVGPDETWKVSRNDASGD